MIDQKSSVELRHGFRIVDEILQDDQVRMKKPPARLIVRELLHRTVIADSGIDHLESRTQLPFQDFGRRVLGLHAPAQRRRVAQHQHAINAGWLCEQIFAIAQTLGVDAHVHAHQESGCIRRVHKPEIRIRHRTLEHHRVLPHFHAEIEAVPEHNAYRDLEDRRPEQQRAAHNGDIRPTASPVQANDLPATRVRPPA
jgi:hypothetical protein